MVRIWVYNMNVWALNKRQRDGLSQQPSQLKIARRKRESHNDDPLGHRKLLQRDVPDERHAPAIFEPLCRYGRDQVRDEGRPRNHDKVSKVGRLLEDTSWIDAGVVLTAWSQTIEPVQRAVQF